MDGPLISDYLNLGELLSTDMKDDWLYLGVLVRDTTPGFTLSVANRVFHSTGHSCYEFNRILLLFVV